MLEFLRRLKNEIDFMMAQTLENQYNKAEDKEKFSFYPSKFFPYTFKLLQIIKLLELREKPETKEQKKIIDFLKKGGKKSVQNNYRRCRKIKNSVGVG